MSTPLNNLMTNFIVQPNPEVKISNQEYPELPLINFHIIAVVEPDPESWMPHPDNEGGHHSVISTYTDLIMDELFPDKKLPPSVKVAEDVEMTKMLWVGGGGFSFYYEEIAEIFASVAFNFDYEEYEDLRYYIQGVAQHHPTWRVAVFGAMFEDDVMRVANSIHESGLETTVLTRYCLSSSAFINLNELISLRNSLGKGLLDDLDI